LINQDRRVPNLKNRADEATEQVVVSYAIEYPAHGQNIEKLFALFGTKNLSCVKSFSCAGSSYNLSM
jgi:hypothetical protein